MKHESKKKIKSFYDQFLAGCSDEERSDGGRARLAVSLGKNASTVLDAGCGTGSLTRLLTKLLSDSYVIGIDISRKSCKVAHNKTGSQNNKVEFLVADLAYLPFRDSSFDLIIFSEVVEHIFLWERKSVIFELRRVVNPYGHLLLTTPNGLHPVILLREFLNQTSRGRIQMSNQIYDRPLSPRSLIALLKKAGWKIQGLSLDDYATGTRIRVTVPKLSIFAIRSLIVACPEVATSA